MRVLITGAHGQIGHELVRLAPSDINLVTPNSNTLDISQAEQVQQALESLKPDLIINAAAYTAVDKAETDAERAYAVNHGGPLNLAQAAHARQIPLLHISTDYVFDGQASCAYQESDFTNPSSVYGSSKLAGELAIQQHCAQHIILRTSWVFGTAGHNFVKTMLRLGQERDALSIVADQQGCPTSAQSIAQALWHIVAHCRSQATPAWGLYHYSGTPACTWYDFAQAIFEQAAQLGLINTVPELSAISTTDYPTPAQRPLYSVLDNQRIITTFGLQPQDWRQDLEWVLQRLHA